MTTLAIIGGGIAGRSLLYTLAKKKKNFSSIVLFDSDSFARTCSLRSTAIVAMRGVTVGHSDLGDLLVAAFKTFSEHINLDRPQGVFPITQYSGATSKLDQFQKRYPAGSEGTDFPTFALKKPIYMAAEPGFLIDTQMYLKWLTDQTAQLPLSLKNEFVTAVNENEAGVEVKTQTGETTTFDKVIFAGGIYNRFWNPKKAGRPVHGSYLEFSNINLGRESFSLTLEGDNFVYHGHTQKLLLGSSSRADAHELPVMQDLVGIHDRLSKLLDVSLPPIESARILTGIREKSSKRSPYSSVEGRTAWIGGFYKNGYSLGLHMSLDLTDQFLP